MTEMVMTTFAEGIAALIRGDQQARDGELLQAIAISTICDTYQVDHDYAMAVFEQHRHYGADGTSSVGEFVTIEIAAALGISVGSAINRIAAVLNIRDRHPVLWEAALAGSVRLYQAASVADQCLELSAEAAAIIDAKVAAALPQWPWSRLLKELPGWILAADPARAEAREVLARRERKVHVTDIKDGQVEVFARLAPADGIAFNDAISAIAADLPHQDLPADVAELVLTDAERQRVALNQRRAAAMGELARAAFGQDALPVRELIVTIDATQVPPTDQDGDVLTGSARVERWGELLASRLPELLAGSKVIVRPVINPATLGDIDPHDPSPAMRLALITRDEYCISPYGATRSRSCDAEHTVPYREGRRGQTGMGLVGMMSRLLHRAKTAGRLQVRQIAPGLFGWKMQSGLRFLVDHTGTYPIPAELSLPA